MKRSRTNQQNPIGIGKKIRASCGELFDEYTCLCGSGGFYFDCDLEGFPLNYSYGTAHYVRCEDCDRIINRKTLRVEGMFGKYVRVPDGSGWTLGYVPYGEKYQRGRPEKVERLAFEGR